MTSSRLCAAALVVLGCTDSGVARHDPPCTPPAALCTVAGTGEPGRDTGQLYLPQGVTWGPRGRPHIADTFNNRVLRVTRDGSLRALLEGTSGGLHNPTDLAFTADGELLVMDWQNSRLVRLPSDGTSALTIVGTGERGYSGPSAPLSETLLDLPSSVVVSPDGAIFVMDQANQLVREVRDGGLVDIAGTPGVHGFAGDGGPATDAQLHALVGQRALPSSQLAATTDRIVLADTGNHLVREIDLQTATISTLAGHIDCSDSGCRGVPGSGEDGAPALSAGLAAPYGVAIANDGVVLVADTSNHCIRALVDDTVRTVAGQCGVAGYGGDGGDPRDATLYRPGGLAIDSDGWVLVADTHNHAVRAFRLDP